MREKCDGNDYYYDCVCVCVCVCAPRYDVIIYVNVIVLVQPLFGHWYHGNSYRMNILILVVEVLMCYG